MIRKEDKDYLDQRFKDYGETMDAKMSGISGKITAGFDMVQLQLNEIIEHQKRTNGNVMENKLHIKHLQDQTRFVRWCNRNPTFAGILLLVLAFGVVFAVSYFGLDVLLKLA